MDDKLIVSNRRALKSKYGAGGFAKVLGAVRALIAADKQRGIRSRLVFIDDAAAMKKLKAPPVTVASSPRQAKAAIDAVFRATDPEYLMILGSPDVVPQQDLINPLYSPPDDDPDACAWGDLPYACEAGYSRDVSAFKGPTRVVGRLPDLAGARDPSYLLGVLDRAARYQPRDVADYGAYFGLSTRTWRESTALSLFNIFGNSKELTLSPPASAKNSDARLAPLMHFINCHGGQADPQFYGEDAKHHFPVSLSSTAIAGRIHPGTVAAAECCYGGEMYDSVTLGLPMPIGQHYLAQGAFAFVGSSTIAYGPADSNGAADLLTQYFLLAVLEGASTGRAMLMARQRFVQQTAELDPMDLKTLAQFSLLGDPAVHPARVPNATVVPRGVASSDALRLQRRERRAKLRAAGDFLEATKPATSLPQVDAPCSAQVRQALARIAQSAGLGANQAFVSYVVQGGAVGASAAPVASSRTLRGKAPAATMPTRYHVAIATPSRPTRTAAAPHSAVAAVAREVDGRIVAYRVYVQR
ncbi:MAG: C25 family cysteine peptidase [Burkholderiaceae bacterium]|nr:C25 family cysteine peptidase [Burkholderiaceae bacterium]